MKMKRRRSKCCKKKVSYDKESITCAVKNKMLSTLVPENGTYSISNADP